jgi:Kef-type K+ transport system membrane component KefB
VDIISNIVMLFVLFFLANVGHYLFEKIRLPGMMGEIIFGILAANIVIAGLGDWNLLDRIGIVIETPTSAGSAGYETLMLFSELGVIFLLFTVGLETQVGDLFRVGKPAVFSALLGIAVPFSLGLVFMAVMDEGLMSSIFISTALITTSAGVAAYVLKSLRMTNTPEGQIIVGAAVISEIVTLTVLAVLSGVAAGDTSPLGIAFTVFKSLAFVVLALYVCFRVMPKINAHIDSRRRDDHTDWTMLFAGIGVCFAMAIAAGKMGLSVIVGAYFAGMMFAEYAEEWNLIKEIESVKEFFMTFFFISVGIRVVLSDLASADVLILAAGMSAIAIAGKHLACAVGAKLGDRSLDRDSMDIIGWGMVPKAEVVMVIAAMGVGYGAIGVPVFSCVVIMAIVATAVSHFMVWRSVIRKYGENGVPGIA